MQWHQLKIGDSLTWIHLDVYHFNMQTINIYIIKLKYNRRFEIYIRFSSSSFKKFIKFKKIPHLIYGVIPVQNVCIFFTFINNNFKAAILKAESNSFQLFFHFILTIKTLRGLFKMTPELHRYCRIIYAKQYVILYLSDLNSPLQSHDEKS